MPTDVISEVAMTAWRRFLRAHCSILRDLDAELRADHGLTVNDYDVLVQLRDTDGHRLRMSDLAEHVVLTRSGMTRLIDGLVREELVERISCKEDARVSYAQVTEAGLERLQSARGAHHEGINRAFASHFTDGELRQLSDLLAKLPAAEMPMRCS